MRKCLLYAFFMAALLPPGDAGAQQIKIKANLQFPVGHPVFGGPPLGINEKKWQSLSPDHRQAIARAARTVEHEIHSHHAKAEAHDQAFAKSKGVKVHGLTPK